MEWFAARRVTLGWIAASSLVTLGVAGAAWLVWPEGAAPSSAGERLAHAVALLKFPAAVLLAMVMSCFRVFDRVEALDTLAAGESDRFRVNHRVLTNSIEQLAIFAPALAALAVAADTPASWRFVSAAVALFTAGRVLFWIGYHVRPNARAFGFNLSFVTSVATLCAAFVLA